MTEAQAQRRRTTGSWLPGLRRARLNAGLTLKELERRTDEQGMKVYKATISELENERRGAYPRTAYALARALGVEVERLMGG